MSKWFVFLLFTVHLSFTIQASEYHFASVENVAEQEVGQIVLTEIYQQLGIDVSISAFSAKRAEYEATTGLKDGEIMRIWAYGDENKNLIRVPTPYYHIATTAFINKDSKLVIDDKKDLAGHRIAIVSGFKHTKAITKGLKLIVETHSTTNSFKLLEQGAVDIVLADYIDGLWTLSKLAMDHNIIASPKPLKQLNLYHYIHQDNQQLVEVVDNKIAELAASGELDSIIQKAQHQVYGNVKTALDFAPLVNQ
ncbi:substrate-binding periplasmic protein [Thalassotalea piscium]|uniref:Solute-binding protein family 3/N-terminal domain-containing protein n=1 Tax=Thalassotalea piscium TaxID=1230533 RepID=A0A7X0NJV8_9GAMM|nr:transporter substrate-binding domain-containing protein [Thalassotalea piscium]MBB6544822.1 hypothetical protein [Thalassotalea piscium]